MITLLLVSLCGLTMASNSCNMTDVVATLTINTANLEFEVDNEVTSTDFANLSASMVYPAFNAYLNVDTVNSRIVVGATAIYAPKISMNISTDMLNDIIASSFTSIYSSPNTTTVSTTIGDLLDCTGNPPQDDANAFILEKGFSLLISREEPSFVVIQWGTPTLTYSSEAPTSPTTPKELCSASNQSWLYTQTPCYQEGDSCKWTINAPAGSVASITVTNFDVSSNDYATLIEDGKQTLIRNGTYVTSNRNATLMFTAGDDYCGAVSFKVTYLPTDDGKNDQVSLVWVLTPIFVSLTLMGIFLVVLTFAL